MDEMVIYGIPTQSHVPALLTSQTGGGNFPLVDAKFETNPMDGECDQRVNLTTRPVEVVYDAVRLVLFHILGN